MKKDEVYRLIEYDGVYDDKVKKNLRKLIKKYHPDHKGDAKVLKIIFEVKKELENNKVSYSFKEDKVVINDEFDYDWLDQLKRLQKEKTQKDTKLHNLYQDLSKKFKKYSSYYQQYCQLQNNFCNQYDELREIKKISGWQLIGYFILLLAISIYIYFPSIYILIILISFIIYLLYSFYRKSLQIRKSKLILNRLYIKQKSFDKKISDMRLSIKETTEAINDLNHDILKISNNIRYYENKLNKKS